MAMGQVCDDNAPPALRGQKRQRVLIPVLCCPRGDSPSITQPQPPTQLWGAHRAHSPAGGRADLGRHTFPLSQDAPGGSEDEGESCTHHHLAGYVPDISILAWLALPGLPCTADAALL